MTNTLKLERARHDFTQADVAEKIGVSRQTVIAIESGKYVPSTVLALKLAKLFDRPVEQIFQLEETD